MIRIKNARQNNLKNISIDIPFNKLIAITGVSGSGKSSLAFDTLYAEGQRRYIETFSPYVRQFMERLDTPQVESIENIPPAIAIDRKFPVKTSRSTVGTISELTDYVKLLFPRIAILYCKQCGREIRRETPFHVWNTIKRFEGKKLIISFPIYKPSEEKIKELISLGFSRAYSNGVITSIESCSDDELYVVVDRTNISFQKKNRIIASIEQAFRFGKGFVALFLDKERFLFSSRLECSYCGITYKDPFPNLFSFNSPAGACSECKGFGKIIDIDLNLIIPDKNKSLKDGAIRPWGSWREQREEFIELMEFCKRHNISVDIPFKDLSDEQKDAIINGTEDYYGIRGFFEWLETKKYKMHVRVYLSRYRGYITCPVCNGTRFKKETLLFRINGLNIAEIYGLSIHKAKDFFDSIKIPSYDKATALILDEIKNRLSYLKEVGLGYLTLDRQSRTLSSGELQRLSLTAALGASLVDSLYILDEPSIGLHARDTERLIGILKRLRNQRNTVLVVEHDPEIIKSADMILDLGPGAGDKGGKIVYFGPSKDIDKGLTADYLKGRKVIPVPQKRRRPKGYIYVKNASEHNLKNLNIKIPLNIFVCITGVSGSGKSTLAEEIIYKGIKRIMGDNQERAGKFAQIIGAELLSDVILVDQSPIGRTPRGNILTYTKTMDHIRRILANTESAKKRDIPPSYFSFNVAGGRCETCKGEGYERVEMQFLSDVFLRCPDCNGSRYKEKILEIKYKGKNISDIFSMTVDEALNFFNDVPEIKEALNMVSQVGLGYLKLGQPINTLSAGESQRLKLSRFLNVKGKNLLFILDEPTVGLHFEDINRLLKVLHDLIDNGNSLIVIEHNMEVIKSADWIIDLGPEGGEDGGFIVAEGPPEKIISCSNSYTGKFLKKYLASGFKDKEIKTKDELSPPCIVIKGAREHNLKDIELTLPRQKLVVITGVSGSGKSSLVYDVIFSEGQRRYLECLAPYVRQYIKIIERADVDHIYGLPPTVAIEQRISQAGRRSTVGTITEIYHFLRLIFANLGKRHCPECGKALEVAREEEIISRIIKKYKNSDAILIVPKVMRRKGMYKDLFLKAYKKGIKMARIDGIFTQIKEDMSLERYKEHNIDFVLGKLPSHDTEAFIADAIKEGDGTIIVLNQEGKEEVFSKYGICPECGIGVKRLDPILFSFNSKYGACSVCSGLGLIYDSKPCPECNGKRLNKDALSVKINGYSIWDMTTMTAEELYHFLKEISFSERERKIANPILREIFSRLLFMDQLGISYLTLDRSADTLSGGEAQRVRFAAQLGSNLRGACYILDEPTIGLHPRDNKKLIAALKNLRDKGNTVIVVEHDEELIKNADYIVDIGPGAGINGGKIVAQGSLEDIKNNKDSITGKYIGVSHTITSRLRSYKDRPSLKIIDSYEHNLKHIEVNFPLGVFICVTGVSGSGKSTLIKETLLKGLIQKKKKEKLQVKCRDIIGCEFVDRVMEVDHSPIGNTPRSVPASYIGILSYIRQLFSLTPDARERGYKAGRFSFNVKGGRCEACKGFGYIKVGMSFLPDVYIRCETCNGTRFNSETLEIEYKRKNISQVLDMTFDEAKEFFSTIPYLHHKISLVCDVGLGYLKLGQPSPELSGGEAQRIKLVKELSKSSNGHTLYILDEPTTGLHIADIRKLLDTLHRIVDKGNTVIAIEHNLEVIKEADYIIELGPEGGKKGGKLIFSGSPLELLKFKGKSYTAEALREYITYSKS